MQNTEFPWMQPYHDTPIVEAQYADLLAAAGCTNLACLRALPSDKLANASQAAYWAGYAAKRYGYGDFLLWSHSGRACHQGAAIAGVQEWTLY
jgi:hypothetical protein